MAIAKVTSEANQGSLDVQTHLLTFAINDAGGTVYTSFKQIINANLTWFATTPVTGTGLSGGMLSFDGTLNTGTWYGSAIGVWPTSGTFYVARNPGDVSLATKAFLTLHGR